MTLNFSKIKSEADQSAKEDQAAIDKEKRTIASVIQHKIELRELFKSLFKEQNIELKNGGMQLSVSFGGGIEVSLYISNATKLENGTIGKSDKEVNPIFVKHKNGKVISSASFIDATDYSGSIEENIEYQYSYKVGTETRTVKFNELKQYLQHVIDG